MNDEKKRLSNAIDFMKNEGRKNSKINMDKYYAEKDIFFRKKKNNTIMLRNIIFCKTKIRL